MRVLILVAFFLSGLSSLVLENLWVRMLSLVFGGTTFAIVTVLTVFMGGLALGSHLAGKIADRLRRPVLVYGLLEAGIALYALAIPSLLSVLPTIYRAFPETLPFLALAFLRFVLCALVLLLPTTLMGATLPILARYFVRYPHTIGLDVGLLYSINTFGAVAGALGGGFLLLPLFGLDQTLWVVSFSLLGLAVALLALGSSLPPIEEKSPEARPITTQEVKAFSSVTSDAEVVKDFFSSDGLEAVKDEPVMLSEAVEEAGGDASLREMLAPLKGRFVEDADGVASWLSLTPQEEAHQRRAIGVTLAMTGATAMICQVIWSRALAMVIGSSTYAFTLILGVFLIGLAAGASLGAWIARRTLEPIISWARLLLATAISIAAGSLIIDRLPVIFASFVYGIASKADPVVLFGIKAAVSSIPILLPTLLMGTFFPVALAIWGQDRKEIGASVGSLYTISTFGSIVGSAGAGFAIIPLLGLRGGLALCVLLYLASALWLIWPLYRDRRLVYGLAAGLTGILILAAPSWNQGRMGLGSFRISGLRTQTYRQATKPGTVLFYKEGINATVSVEGSPDYRALKVNGKTDASSHGDRSTQIGVALVPLLFHGQAKDGAIIGWGSGMTVGAALHFPLKSLVAVELEAAVVEASKLFEPWNFHPLRDPRLVLLENDGRNYLATTRRKFDVVISEPSNPWMSGVANLFTVEYFRLAKERLQPGGVFCQWIQLYEMSYENVLSILFSLHEVFPYVRLFEIELDSYDTMVLASMTPEPLMFDLPRKAKHIADPRFKGVYEPMSIQTPYDLFPRFQIGEKELKGLLVGQNPHRNTDGYNRLEFTAPLDLFRQSSQKVAARFGKAVSAQKMHFPTYLKAGTQPRTKAEEAEFWRQIGRSHLRYGLLQRSAKFLQKAKDLAPALPGLSKDLRLQRLMDGQETFADSPASRPASLPTSYPTSRRASLIKNAKALHKAAVFYTKDEYNKCIMELLPAIDDPEFARLFPESYYYLGACYRYLDKTKDALHFFSLYIQARPRP